MAKALVVEDDTDILNLVVARCRRAGHQVIGVASGQEALEVLDERGDPDVAILDVGLPNMTGLELLEKLRARPGLADLPVIFLSARVQPEEIEAGRALGATYLTKPFVASALLAAIERTIPSEDSW
ncbi:MAG: response regulator [Actinomycetota bacterium]